MTISRIDLINRAIPKAFRGYECGHVDRLMQDMSDALAKAADEKVALTARVNKAEEALSDYRQREMALQDALVASRRMAEDLREAAQKEAQLIMETARLKAEGLLQNANVRLARILEEISAAERLKVQFEAKLRNIIEEHLRLLDFEKDAEARFEKILGKASTGIARPEE